ncbi:hypothetical protein BCM20_000661 [Clostridium beijerinckii]|nr:hypothetical protein [Clostridium beijerinckii]NOW06150.1 hypothetical protein [Clostridium beijerinckii]NYC00706.1 hypothetical protein [Clostridium beijerinckii]
MIETGNVQESFSGPTYAAFEKGAFAKQAKPGSVYVEFDVPEDSYIITNDQEGWIMFNTIKTPQGRLAAKKGLSVAEAPPEALNIKLVDSK